MQAQRLATLLRTLHATLLHAHTCKTNPIRLRLALFDFSPFTKICVHAGKARVSKEACSASAWGDHGVPGGAGKVKQSVFVAPQIYL